MGMYTTLRFEAKLHDVGIHVVKKLIDAQNTREGLTAWDDSPWCAVEDLIDVTPSWRAQSRKNFIPFGGLSYCYWEDDSTSFDVRDDGVWYVICSLKNYDNTIAVFLHDILPQLLSEPCDAQTWYEEDDEPVGHRVEPSKSYNEAGNRKEGGGV